MTLRRLAMVLLLAGLAAQARADGGFVWRRGADLNEPFQKAILCWREGVEKLVLQVKYEGPAEDFAWIVPLPARPEVVAVEPDKSPFAEISLYTQRRYRWGYRGKGLDAGQAEERVTVLERKVVGVYDVAVLAASDAAALAGWLNRNGYAFPEKRKDVLDHYTKKGWVYVAMRIDPKALGKDEVKKLKTGELQPVRFTFRTREMVYPLKISSVNAGTTEVLLYVLADAPMVVSAGPKASSLSPDVARHPDYQDPRYGTYRRAAGHELPLTWEALDLDETAQLSLCKYRVIYESAEMTDDLVFAPFEPVPYWKAEVRRSTEGKARWGKWRALSVLAWHDPDVLHELANHEEPYVRALAARNPKAPPELLRKFWRDKFTVKLAVAGNEDAPGDVLAALAKDERIYVRQVVAANPGASEALLRALAKDEDPSVRGTIACNSKAPLDLLRALAEDKDGYVRSSLIRNPSVTLDILRKLVQDRDSSVRGSMAYYAPKEMLARLAVDEAAGVRFRVAENPRTPPGVLARLAADEDEDVRRAAGANPRTPEAALRKLAKSESADIRAMVACNSGTPSDLLAALARDPDARVRERVARHLRAPVEVLRRLSEDADVSVRRAVAISRLVPFNVLRQLAGDEAALVRGAVACNPRTEPAVLRKLAGDEEQDVRRYVASNPRTSPEALRALATDKSANVRGCVVRNRSTSDGVLGLLARDEDRSISSHALEVLHQRARHPRR